MIYAIFLMNLFLAFFIASPLDAMLAVRQAATKVNVPAKMQVKRPNVSFWTRVKSYFSQKRSFHTSDQARSKKSFTMNFDFKKLFNFQNPFTWKNEGFGRSYTGSRAYTRSYSELDEEKINGWFTRYKQEKGLSGAQYPLNIDVIKYILKNDNANAEAMEYAYILIEEVLKSRDMNPRVVSVIKDLTSIAQTMKLADFINLFEQYREGSRQGEQSHEREKASGTRSAKQEASYAGTTGRGFWSHMSMPLRMQQYTTDEQRYERILTIVKDYLEKVRDNKDYHSNLGDQREEIYRLFSGMTRLSSKAGAFEFIAKSGIGKNDARFKTLYKELANTQELKEELTRDTNSGASFGPDVGPGPLQSMKIIRGILNSYYTEYPEAVDWAYDLYNRCDERTKFFGDIVKSGITKTNEKFRSLYTTLYPEYMDVAETILQYDADNPQAIAFVDRIIQRWIDWYKKKKDMKSNESDLAVVRNFVTYLVKQVKVGTWNTERDATTIYVVLKRIFMKLQNSNVDQQVVGSIHELYNLIVNYYQFYWLFYETSLLKKFVDLFEKYGFSPSSQRESGKQEQARQARAEGSLNEAYKTLGVPMGAPFAVVEKQYKQLAKQYHSDMIRNKYRALMNEEEERAKQEKRAVNEKKMKQLEAEMVEREKEATKKMQEINPAYAIIKAHEDMKKERGTKENL